MEIAIEIKNQEENLKALRAECSLVAGQLSENYRKQKESESTFVDYQKATEMEKAKAQKLGKEMEETSSIMRAEKREAEKELAAHRKTLNEILAQTERKQEVLQKLNAWILQAEAKEKELDGIENREETLKHNVEYLEKRQTELERVLEEISLKRVKAEHEMGKSLSKSERDMNEMNEAVVRAEGMLAVIELKAVRAENTYNEYMQEYNRKMTDLNIYLMQAEMICKEKAPQMKIVLK